MAKSRVTTNPMYVGGAGGYSFYVRGGEQVIRQRKNNSNYGAGASRTRAQMIRRIRWGNLVNVFKSQKSWQPKAYDSKTKGQTDYNIFMALNINQATVGLTKEMCLSGCAVIEGYQVSRGSLPPIALSASQSGSFYVTDIKLTISIGSSTTVGQLAADIIANNSQFQEGDNIAFISFKNWLASRVEWPYAASSYAEITLDPTSAVLLSSIPVVGSRLGKDSNGNLQVGWSSTGQYDTTREVGFVAIHTRKSASLLAVSSQEILMNSNSLVAQFSGTTWDNTCIDSYGLSDEVPLDPSFPEASIQSVTANGSAVVEGETLTGSQELVITGSNLSTRSVKVFFNGVEYTPLGLGVDSLQYLIGDNGTVRVVVNGRVYLNFSVSGVVVPQFLPVRMSARQKSDNRVTGESSTTINYLDVRDTNCINYPYVVDEEYPYYLLFFYAADLDQSDFGFHNCELNNFLSESSPSRMNVSVIDNSKVAYITYQGFIVAVFNYSL